MQVFRSAPPHTYASVTNSRSGTKYGGWSVKEYSYPRFVFIKIEKEIIFGRLLFPSLNDKSNLKYPYDRAV